MQEKSQTAIDVAKIKKATRMGIPFSITTYTLPHEIELYIADVVTCFLAELGQERLKDYLIYCINELTTNAKKANTKRVYFIEQKLNINDDHDYEVGMKTFKADTLENIGHYLQLQKEAGLFVKVVMQVKGPNIIIEIRNNAEMTKTEFKRVFDKLARSQQFTSLEEALSQVLDDSEGAGLGLVIMILMLKKVGLSDENYQVTAEKGETITRILMPVDVAAQTQLGELTTEIVSYIDTLPQFPDNIAIDDCLPHQQRRRAHHRPVKAGQFRGLFARQKMYEHFRSGKNGRHPRPQESPVLARHHAVVGAHHRGTEGSVEPLLHGGIFLVQPRP